MKAEPKGSAFFIAAIMIGGHDWMKEPCEEIARCEVLAYALTRSRRARGRASATGPIRSSPGRI